jgi:hypothetical protein
MNAFGNETKNEQLMERESKMCQRLQKWQSLLKVRTSEGLQNNWLGIGVHIDNPFLV